MWGVFSHWRAVALVVLALGGVHPGTAAGAEPSDRDKATAMLKEGAAFYKKGDFHRALGNFKAAYAVFPSPKVQYNFGLAYQGLQQNAEALKAFEAFVREAPDAGPQLLADARERIRRLETRVTFLTLSWDGDEAEVLIDGALAGRTPLAGRVPVEPGQHELVVRSTRSGTHTRNFAALTGRSVELQIASGGRGTERDAAAGTTPSASAGANASGAALAEALITEATALRRAGRHSKAYPLLSRAYAAQTSARTAAQLGLVELQLGYWLDSERHLGEGLASPRDPWVAEHREDLEASLVKVKAAIGEFVVTGAPPGSLVLVNGRPAGTVPLPAPIRVGEGPVNVEIRPPGRPSEFRSLIMLGGQRQEIALDGMAAAPPAAVATTEEGPPPSPARTGVVGRALAWTAAGLSAGALAVGLWQTQAWRSRLDDFERYRAPATAPGPKTCGADDPNRGAPGCAAIYTDFRRARALAVGGYFTAAGLAAGAAALFLISSRTVGSTVDVASSTVDVACGPTLAFSGGTCLLNF